MDLCDVTPTLFGLKITHPNWITLELFRNGYYEIRIPIDIITFPRFQFLCIHHKKTISFVVNYFRALASLVEYFGVAQEIVTYLAFFNIEKLKLEYFRKIPGTDQVRELESIWEKPDLKIPAKSILSIENPDAQAKVFMDAVWNAFGFEEAPYFKENKYIPGN